MTVKDTYRRIFRLSDFHYCGHYFVCYAIATNSVVGGVLSNVKIVFVMDGNILDDLNFAVSKDDLISAIDENESALTGEPSDTHAGGIAAPSVADAGPKKLDWDFIPFDFSGTCGVGDKDVASKQDS